MCYDGVVLLRRTLTGACGFCQEVPRERPRVCLTGRAEVRSRDHFPGKKEKRKKKTLRRKIQ